MAAISLWLADNTTAVFAARRRHHAELPPRPAASKMCALA